MSNDDDVWAQVAKAALEQQPVPKAPVCAHCRQPVVVNEHSIVKPHFAKVTDERPCRRSFLPLDPAQDPKPKAAPAPKPAGA